MWIKKKKKEKKTRTIFLRLNFTVDLMPLRGDTAIILIPSSKHPSLMVGEGVVTSWNGGWKRVAFSIRRCKARKPSHFLFDENKNQIKVTCHFVCFRLLFTWPLILERAWSIGALQWSQTMKWHYIRSQTRYFYARYDFYVHLLKLGLQCSSEDKTSQRQLSYASLCFDTLWAYISPESNTFSRANRNYVARCSCSMLEMGRYLDKKTK
jgi:hypothetical protein